MIIAQVVLVGGVLAVLGSVLFGILFSTSGEFVLATIDCNVTENPYGVNDCNADNKVVDSDGDVCQVGNLGLFTSAFTPECALGGEYEVSSIVLPYEGDPLNFGPLFAAQTNLAGAIAELTNGLEVEFTNCDDFFADPVLAGALQAAAVGGFDAGLDTFAEGIKAGYDQGLVDFVGELDLLLYAGASVGIIGGYNFIVTNAAIVGLPAPPLPANVDDNYDLTGSAFGSCGNDTVLAVIGCVASNLTGFGTSAGSAVALGISYGLTTFPSETNIATLIATGVGYQGPNPLAPTPGAPVTALPDAGFWSPFDSTILCNSALGCTTHRDFLSATFASVDSSVTLGNVALQDALDQLTLLIGALDGYRNNVALLLAATIPALTGSTDLDADFTALAALSASTNPDDIVTLTSGLNATVVQAVTINTGFLTKAALIANLQGALQASSLTPPDFTLPALIQSSPPSDLQSWGLLCAVVELDNDCSYLDFVGKSIADSTDPRTIESLSLIGAVLGTCAADNVTTITGCLTAYLSYGAPLTGGGATLLDITTEAVLGSFYPLTTDADDFQAAMLLEAATLCKDDEKDRAAIAAAQQLVPGGIALLGIASILAVVNLVKVQNKILGVVAGLFGILGAGLALAGLLGVYNAPIYESVGGSSGPIEDNSFVYGSGVALTYALVLIGGGFVGGLAVLVGGAMLPGKDESSEILGKA